MVVPPRTEPKRAVAGSERKSDRTRERILDAAAEVFSEQGYSARLSDIAERAGMKAGSLYYHFDSREDLVAEILHRGIQRSFDHAREAVDAMPAGARAIDRLATAVRAHTLAILERSAYASAQARIVGQVPASIATVHQRDQRSYGEYWNGMFEAAAAEGDVAPGADLFVVRMLTFGAMNWIAEWAALAGRRSPEAIADQTVSMLLDGIRGRRPG